MTEWFSWDTALYAGVLALGAIATVATVRYRKVIVELQEVAEVLRESYKDKRITKAEKERIMKEILDVVSALLKSAWSLIR
jgi:hypothetical protein